MIRLLTTILIFFIAPPAFADAPRGFSEATFQGSKPKVSGGEVTFTLLAGQCSSKDYGDGRGESDCKNGNIRSRINANNHAKLGQTMEYSLDMWIQPGFRYSKGNEPRSKLTIMEWQRIYTIKNHIYVLHLDSSGGVKFEDKTCFSAKQFGQWVKFNMRVKWSKEDDGFMEVLCDGKRIFALQGQNAIPPGCGTKAKQQCQLDKMDLRHPIQWQVGPKLNGFGTVYKQFGKTSPFRPWPKDGLVMKVRNLYYGRPKN
jgi:hypothetical protein